jgi:hypothetical protein
MKELHTPLEQHPDSSGATHFFDSSDQYDSRRRSVMTMPNGVAKKNGKQKVLENVLM